MGRRKEGERALARRWMYHYTPVIITFSFFFVLMTTTISYCFTIFVICIFARILLPLKVFFLHKKKMCSLLRRVVLISQHQRAITTNMRAFTSSPSSALLCKHTHRTSSPLACSSSSSTTRKTFSTVNHCNNKKQNLLSPSSSLLSRKNRRVKIVAKVVGSDDEKVEIDAKVANKRYKWAVVGCDSDAGGALAIIRGDFVGDVQTVEIVDVPTMTVSVNGKARKRLDVAKMIEKVKEMDLPNDENGGHSSVVFVEEGGVEFGFSAQTAFVQGYNFGLWKGVLESCVNPETTRVEVVKPQAWKLALGLKGKKTSKDDSIEMAKLVFPESEDMLQRKKDHGRAESLLIAAYGHARETLQKNSDVEYSDIVRNDVVCKRVFNVLEQKGLVSENGVAYFGPYFGRTGMELKHDLKTRGLKVTGTKGELILRLETDDLRRRSEKKQKKNDSDSNNDSASGDDDSEGIREEEEVLEA